MNKYAIIKNGVVINIIEYDEQPSTPPPGFEEGHVAVCSDYANPGWVYADGQFTDPNPPQVVELPKPLSLVDSILSNPDELTKLKQALEI